MSFTYGSKEYFAAAGYYGICSENAKHLSDAVITHHSIAIFLQYIKMKGECSICFVGKTEPFKVSYQPQRVYRMFPFTVYTFSFDMPWLPLFNDIKQGIFYAALMVFWLVFSGEHLINDDGTGEKNGLVAYWKKLAIVMFGCLCLFIFDVCERGVQLKVHRTKN